jgi:hypothetical protein
MAIDVSTVITDYNWAEPARPILTITEDCKAASFQLGTSEHNAVVELTALSVSDLLEQFHGLAELFQRAVEVLSERGK